MKTKVLNVGKTFLKHELVNNSLYLLIGNNISNFLAFILNLFLARLLIPQDYGEYASLLSIFTLMGILVQGLMTIITRFATDYFAQNKNAEAASLYFKMFKFVGITAFVIFIGFCIFSFQIKNFLHLNNIWYVFILALAITFSYLTIINTAFIQSILRFGFLSSILISSVSMRLIIGVILITLGFRVFGAVWAMFTSTFFAFILGFIPLRFIFKYRSESKNIAIPTKEIFSYALPTSLIVFSVSSFTFMDVVLVRHFFTATESGLYAGISLIGKVIFYFTGPIAMVMFPLIIKRNAKGENYQNLFYLSLILVIVPSLAITAFYFLFPEFTINFFLGGGKYMKIAPYLGIFGIYLTIFSILNVFISFFLSLNKTKISILVLAGAISQIVAINFMHNSFFQVIGVSLFISSLLLITLLLYYILVYGKAFKHAKKS